MPITHIFISYPNKSQPYNHKLIERLVKSKVKVKVVSFTNEKVSDKNVITLEHKTIKWFRYILAFLLDTKDFFKFKKKTNQSYKTALYFFGRYSLMNLEKESLLHIHHVQLLNNELISFLKIKKSKIVLSFRGSDILVRPKRTEIEKNFLLNALKNVDAVHAVSSNIKDVVVNYGFKKNKVFVIRRTPEINTLLPIKINNSNIFQITTIARLHWTKGFVLALKALRKLKDNNIKFVYTICGSKENVIFDELIFWVNKLELNDEIKFAGHLNSDELNKVLMNTDVYLQTSLSEGIPNAMLRCLVNRIPTVTTNVGGISEVFRDEIDGVLINELNEEKIFIGLKKLLIDLNFRKKIINSKSVINLDFTKEIELYKEMYTQMNTLR